MAVNKYRVREFTPKNGQLGQHSFFAQAVVDNDITNFGLAKKIAARTGIKSYEVSMVIAAIADVVTEPTEEPENTGGGNTGGGDNGNGDDGMS